ncbi:MAG: DUF1223 domain-containing protein [Paracoccaceae bacterium]
MLRRAVMGGFALAIGALLAAPTPGRAEEPAPIVVELFTSQGCASCPPADEELAELARDPRIITLSIHVDYWDYLGWRDIFGSPAHTERQRAYADFMGERMIYTPQMVVQGGAHVVGSHGAKLRALIDNHRGDKPLARVTLRRNGDLIEIEIAREDAARGSGNVVMAWFTDVENVDIVKGENRGKRLTYHNVVKGWADLGRWDGDDTEVVAPLPEDADGVAVLVQQAVGGPILGAGRLALR